MSNFWDSQEILGTIQKNKRENIVISKCKRNNKEYTDVRHLECFACKTGDVVLSR